MKNDLGNENISISIVWNRDFKLQRYFGGTKSQRKSNCLSFQERSKIIFSCSFHVEYTLDTTFRPNMSDNVIESLTDIKVSSTLRATKDA